MMHTPNSSLTVDAARFSTAHRYVLVNVGDLRESPLNPRRTFDAGTLEELAASIRKAGIVEPLVARLRGTDHAPFYEIIAGARRFRAAKIAGLITVPTIVRELDDAGVLELMVIENTQREDVHPLEEADGYATLMKLDQAYTVEAIAAKTGKSASYIYRRLKLRELVPAARKAFEADELTAAHAERLARLAKDQQAAALKDACFYPLFGAADRSADDQGPGKRDVQPVSKLDEWIARHDRLDVKSPDTPQYFPELASALTSGDGPSRLLELSESHMPGAQLGTKNHGALPHGRWVEIGSKSYTGRVVKPCANVERGIVVHGGPTRILEVCATKDCPVHRPASKKGTTGRSGSRAAADQAAEQRRQARHREEERQRHIRQAFGDALATTIEAKADTLTKLDGRVLGIARAYVFRMKKPLTLRTLPGALVREAVSCVGSWQTSDLVKIATALGIKPKPIEAEAEAKFPKQTEAKG